MIDSHSPVWEWWEFKQYTYPPYQDFENAVAAFNRKGHIQRTNGYLRLQLQENEPATELDNFVLAFPASINGPYYRRQRYTPTNQLQGTKEYLYTYYVVAISGVRAALYLSIMWPWVSGKHRLRADSQLFIPPYGESEYPRPIIHPTHPSHPYHDEWTRAHEYRPERWGPPTNEELLNDLRNSIET